jgi:hypothetical protein
MIIALFDARGIVHKEFVPTGQTVNSGFYCDVLRRLRENVQRRRLKFWREQTLLLHHDNAPSHFRPHPAVLGEKQNCCHPHQPYSPDLAPCDFFVFQKMKLKLKGRRFDTNEEIQAESQRVLNLLEKTSRKSSKN